jgi:outer membrane receptor for ferrienterochelin and colicin
MKYINKALVVAMLFLSGVASSQELSIKVYGACGMCQERIESNAKNIIGVNSASWDQDNNMLTISYMEGLFQENELHQKMASIGHDTDKVKASDEDYENLHGCCKYRVEENSDVENEIVEKFKLDFEEKGGKIDESGSTISGMIYEQNSSGKLEPLTGANVYLVESLAGTSTDLDGYFSFKKPLDVDSELLVVSYMGYSNDTIDMAGQSIVSVVMKTNFIMNEVEIVHKRKTTEISFINPIKVQTIGEKELCKAACCNLSESFETNPSVDAGATDAVTGTKKIEMLGLAGPYVQVTRENMPYIRGLAAVYGFSYTPGTWIESIQLNMGTGSVVNGPESITGQINVEVKKPELSEKLNLNLYSNAAGRFEANANHASQINDRWGTAILLHGNYQNSLQDRNKDNFQDMPQNTQLIAMNRWKYKSEDGKFAQFGIKGTYIDKSSGQISPEEEGPLKGERWRADVETQRIEGWMKIGRIFKDRPYSSIGLQLSASHHDQKALFGRRNYNGRQTSAYANLIYQTIIKDTKHNIKFGSSYQFDRYNEEVGDNTYLRNEGMVGAFTEYQYVPNDKWTLVLGLRGDYHNLFGAFLTPRLHIKYNPEETASIRLIAGRGQRTASIFAEEIGLFASNRKIIIHETNEDTPYGLGKEAAWNVGANYTKEFKINGRSTVFGVDYYYTTFSDQVVVDYDINPQEVHFYNLEGKSYSHSIQTQVDMEVFDGFDLRVAYRFNNPRTDFAGGNRIRPLISKERAFINIGWDLGRGWMYDLTGNWQSSKRIPFTDQNPEEYRFETQSPSFTTFNSQISKTIRNGFDIYLGGENILDFRQENAILSSDNPFNDYFDSSLIWGPIQGRVVYVGMRYKFIN